MIKIHNFARGGRGLRLMWQCEEMGLPYVVEIHSFPVGAGYRALNPLGTVPFLEDTGGVAINESVAMMLYVAQKYGPTSLLPTTDDALLARVFQLTLFGETEIGMNLNSLLTAHFMAPEEHKRNWSVGMLDQRIDRALGLTATLVRDGSFLVGENLTLADISVSCAVGIWQGALARTLPEELEVYQQRLHTRPAYQRARVRCASG
ncbi:MAG: glutathione S-transferase family protein [Xanthobacteraceae bacterium]|jgi:glutathione S-transferase